MSQYEATVTKVSGEKVAARVHVTTANGIEPTMAWEIPIFKMAGDFSLGNPRQMIPLPSGKKLLINEDQSAPLPEIALQAAYQALAQTKTL